MLKRKKVPYKKNAAFCIVPWTHTFLSPQSERRLCAVSRETSSFVHQYVDQNSDDQKVYSPTSLDKHWNGSFLKSIRRQMLAGNVPKECEVCAKQSLNSHTYQRYYNESMFPDQIESAYKNTDSDGKTSMKPISFDYRLTNLCNFKCRMCGPQLSSRWESEVRENQDPSQKLEYWMQDSPRKKIQTFQEEVAEKEFIEAVASGEVREIYWVGGEPLLWPIHWKIMSLLIEQNSTDKTLVRYHTNLSALSFKGQHLFRDILPNLKNFKISASIDGAGKVGEFIRTGLNWENWKNNFEEGLKVCNPDDPDQLVIDVTLTLPGLFGMKELFDFAVSHDAKMYGKFVFAFDPSIVLSPFCLSRELLDDVVDDLLRYCEPRATENTEDFVNFLKSVKEKPVFSETYPDSWRESFRQGRSTQQQLAKHRRDGESGRITIEDILSHHPGVLEWWEKA